MSPTPCSSCGKALATADILYTEDARVVCLECSSKREIQRDEKGAARNIKIASFTCLAAALFGFAAFYIGFGLFFWTSAIISVASGVYAAQAFMMGEDRFTAHLEPSEKLLIMICTGIGLAICAFETLLVVGIIDPRILW
ncbi:MAG: hypothetical protein H0X17_07490 [Deltaproteobacteria bacterium]|nr:hypothetical protein [Deltaproteobacteria bacterium]